MQKMNRVQTMQPKLGAEATLGLQPGKVFTLLEQGEAVMTTYSVSKACRGQCRQEFMRSLGHTEAGTEVGLLEQQVSEDNLEAPAELVFCPCCLTSLVLQVWM